MAKAKADEKTIRIACAGEKDVPLAELEDFQGSLKHLGSDRYFKLRASIAQHGFAFPIMVWRHGKSNKIIDGHQRVAVVRKMVGEDGYTLPGSALPVNFVEAKTEKEAKQLVLAAMSQYGTYEAENLYEFIQQSDLDWLNVKEWAQFPQVNMGALEVGWFNPEWAPDEKEGSDDEADEKEANRLGGEASRIKQVALVLSDEDYATFVQEARELGTRWKLDNLTEVVQRAVSECAKKKK